ncbi:hypothetical protein HDU79_004953 [Rhizoclosmatium sp. JEL0117]|nr:hypothetical protein HDU79_004953 [Rhizoclosmatium sp. JEL0117]
MASNKSTLSVFPPTLYAGKVALVTGGGSGICLGIATALVRHGASVAIVGRTQSKLESAKATIEAATSSTNKVLCIAADVRSFEAINAAVSATAAKFGRLDFVVCGAAGNFLCAAEDLSPNAFKTVVDIDLVGTFNTCKAALPLLKLSKGAIINITATLQYKGTLLMAHACAAKAGVDALTRVLALEWGQYGIRVNAIAPGPIDDTTGMTKLMPSGARDLILSAIPLRRMGTVRDIEFTTLYLFSDAASLVTGAIEVVDGGEWLASPMAIVSSLDAAGMQADVQKKRADYNASKKNASKL